MQTSEHRGGKLKRLSSFPNVMSPFSSFKTSFSRNRQPSQESSSSKKSRKSSGATTTTDASQLSRGSSAAFAHPNTPPPTSGDTGAADQQPNHTRARCQLPRSNTTSFLPVAPRNEEVVAERPTLPHSRTTAVLPRSRIPTPSNSHTRLPTPLDPAGHGVHQYHLGHSRRESFVLLQSNEPRPRTRIPTPVKRTSTDYAKARQIGASRGFAGVGSGFRPVRSQTESNLLAGFNRKSLNAGRRGSSITGSFRPDSCSAPLIESSAENNPSFSPYKYGYTRDDGISPTESFDGEVHCAEYAFSPRRYTPSKALENAMAASAQVSPLTDHTNRPRTPSTIKRFENSTAPPTQPRLSSGHLIKSYHLLHPIQPADAPAGQLPRLSSTTSLHTPRASLSNAPLQHRQSVSRPTPLRTSTEPNSEDELSPTPRFSSTSFAASRLMRQVTSFQPTGYWAGRFMSIRDRLLNETFDVNARPTSSSDILRTRAPSDGRSSSRSTLPACAETELDRCKKIFAELEASCTDYDAHRSLKAFQNAYAKKHRMPGLECEVPPDMLALMEVGKDCAVKTPTPRVGLAKTTSVETDASAHSSDGMGRSSAGRRKTSFMNRLWQATGRQGKSRKSNVKPADEDRKGLMSGEF